MPPIGAGRWQQGTVLPPGTCEFFLMRDGRGLPNPLAKETVVNPFGGKNSVLKVANSREAMHLPDAGNLPMEDTNKQKTQKI
jgi:hypothetical protein